MGQGHCGVG